MKNGYIVFVSLYSCFLGVEDTFFFLYGVFETFVLTLFLLQLLFVSCCFASVNWLVLRNVF